MINKDLIPIDIYKDPLKKNEDGFGYLGCVLQTREEDKLQCHICGKLHGDLGNHLKKHKILARDYRVKFKLSPGTKLISRAVRETKINSYLSHPKESRDKWREMAQVAKRVKDSKIKHSKMSLEVKNKRGSCPDQILEEIKKYYETEKKLPTSTEFIAKHPMGNRYVMLAKRTFGSWSKAVEVAGIGKLEVKDTKGVTKPRWETETLKELLLNFARANNRIPRYSDLLAGELPKLNTYVRRFGSLEKARVASGVYDYF